MWALLSSPGPYVFVSQEKYERATQKINQLKEERNKLKENVEAQSEEISRWVVSSFQMTTLRLLLREGFWPLTLPILGWVQRSEKASGSCLG